MSRIASMTGLYKAKVTFPESPDSSLDLDFEPIINSFNLSKLNNFVLAHWQSHPKGIRGYGFYDWSTKKYHCIDWDSISISRVFVKTLQIDELKHPDTAPTAVLFFPNCKLINFNGEWVIR